MKGTKKHVIKINQNLYNILKEQFHNKRNRNYNHNFKKGLSV